MKILAADLWPSGYPERTYGEASTHELVNGQTRLRQFVENILLYDQVIVPTDNFLSLRFLSLAFGSDALAILSDEGILKFRRLNGTVVYAGAGHGITVVKVDVHESRKKGAPVNPAWLPTGVAATALFSELPGVSAIRAKQLAAKVVHATKEIDLDMFREELRTRTYTSALSNTMDSRLRISKRALDKLELPPDQLRTAGSLESYAPADDIDKFMLVARTQLELIAKEQSGCNDISTLSPVGKILAATPRVATSLERLYQITDVPDIGAAAMQSAISMNAIVELRNSKHWREFVKWFHETCATEPDRVGREYVKLLKLPALLDSPFYKTVRLLISTVAGVINPLAGVVVAAADTYIVPNLKEPSAKYFIERLEQLAAEQMLNRKQD